MTLMVKNWDKFQHYKHRDPPWIKLHRGLLNDLQWHKLSGDAAKTLVMIWLIASETDGKLPPVADLAFRLRLEEQELAGILQQLSHWLVQDDSGTQAECKQDASIVLAPCEQDAPENQKHDSVSVSVSDSDSVEQHFSRFWSVYPKREGGSPKKPARESFNRAVKGAPTREAVDPAVIIAGAVSFADECARKNTDPKYIPMPATWLNQARWEAYAETKQERDKAVATLDSKFVAFEDSKQFKAWSEWRLKTFGLSFASYDIIDQRTGKHRPGRHFDTEWPPGYAQAA